MTHGSRSMKDVAHVSCLMTMSQAGKKRVGPRFLQLARLSEGLADCSELFQQDTVPRSLEGHLIEAVSGGEVGRGAGLQLGEARSTPRGSVQTAKMAAFAFSGAVWQ